MNISPDGVASGDPGDDMDVCLEIEPEALVRYWRGALTLARDDVSSGPFLTGRYENTDDRPVHLATGTVGQARLAMSIHRRLFPGAARVLDKLGDPWFRAGDAVRDPQRNRTALAGTVIGW